MDSSNETAVSSTQLIYSFIALYVLFNLFNYFIVIADIFFFKSIAWNLLSRIPYSVSVIPLTFPDSGCRVLVLPIKIRIFVKNWYRWETTLLLYMYLLFVQQCKLQYVKFHVVANSSSLSLNKSSLATAVVHTSNREIRSCVKWLLTSGLEEWEII